jgi:hypothetical protein
MGGAWVGVGGAGRGSVAGAAAAIAGSGGRDATDGQDRSDQEYSGGNETDVPGAHVSKFQSPHLTQRVLLNRHESRTQRYEAGLTAGEEWVEVPLGTGAAPYQRQATGAVLY